MKMVPYRLLVLCLVGGLGSPVLGVVTTAAAAKASSKDKPAKGKDKAEKVDTDSADETDGTPADDAADLASEDGANRDNARADAAAKLDVAGDPGRAPATADMLPAAAPNEHGLSKTSDLIDYEALVQQTFSESARRAAALKQQAPQEKQRLNAAKQEYKNGKSKTKQADKAQKQQLKSWERARKAQIKKLPKKERKAAGNGFKQEQRNKKRELSNAIGKMKRQAKKSWDKAQRHYKSFQRELKDARYQAKAMPKYKKKLKPKLLRELKKLNSVLAEVTKNASTAAKNSVSLAAIAKMRGDVVLGYLKYIVGEKVRPAVENGVDGSLDKLFNMLDKVVSIAIRAIVAAVGSVPFVGGILAAAASAAGQMIYSAIKKTVTNSVRKLGKRIATRLIEDIGARLFKVVSVGTPTDDAVAAAAIAAANASNTHLAAAGNRYEQDAAAEEAKPYAFEKDAVADAQELSKEAATDEKEIASAETEEATPAK